MKPKIKHAQKDDRLDLYIAEYNNLWQERLARVDAQKQILNLQIAVIAASVSGVAFFQEQPILYLFGALLLSLLSWMMMEQTTRINNIITYIRTVLNPKIDAIFPEDGHPILEWSTWLLKLKPANFLFELLNLVKFVVGPLLAILFCTFFAIAKQFLNMPWNQIEVILLVSSVVAFLIPLLIGLISVFITYKKK